MSVSLIITNQARDDLADITAFIAQDNPAQARDFVAKFQASVQDTPFLGPSSIPDQCQLKRHPQSIVSVERRSDTLRIMKISADHGLPIALISIGIRYRENKPVHLDHHHRLDQIAVDRVAHPSPTSLNLKTTPPPDVVPVHLILQRRLSVLAEEYRAMNPIRRLLTLLDLESKRCEIGSEPQEDLIAGQTFRQLLGRNTSLMVSEDIDDLQHERRRRLGLGEALIADG